MTMMVNMNMFTQLNLSIKHVVLHSIHPYGHGFGIDGPKSISVHFSLSKDDRPFMHCLHSPSIAMLSSFDTPCTSLDTET
jgi:hypothetical protein